MTCYVSSGTLNPTHSPPPQLACAWLLKLNTHRRDPIRPDLMSFQSRIGVCYYCVIFTQSAIIPTDPTDRLTDLILTLSG